MNQPPEDALVMGVDAGTESLRVGLFDLSGHLISSCSKPYETSFPHNGWAEQNPIDWWNNLGECSRKVMMESEVDPSRVMGICIDTTCCSVVALDANGNALRPCLLWMDSRSANQCESIINAAKDDPHLQVNSGGEGPLSAEWMIPKALWMKENEPDIWSNAHFICEKQDYLNFHLTGHMTASACNVAARWHFNAQQAVYNSSILGNNEHDWMNDSCGRPVSLLKRIDLLDLLNKWPRKINPMGTAIGSGLTEEASCHLGLNEGTIVAQGGPDAYVGMVGLGCIHKGEVALITGSSHLHLCVCDNPLPGIDDIGTSGVWGVYRAAPITNVAFAEGGQSSTGSVLSWMKNLLSDSSRSVSYGDLDVEADKVPIGADGLLALETFQGSRTPVTNPNQRGALIGLSLAHSRGHIWRAFLEAVCYGTRASLEALDTASIHTGGQKIRAISMAGGATRSSMWLQMHADVTQLPISIGEFDNSPLLGCAVLASASLYSCDQQVDKESKCVKQSGSSDLLSPKIELCTRNMVRKSRIIEPNRNVKEKYDNVYKQYVRLAPVLTDLFSNISSC